MTADFAHCRRLVESQDRERFLALAFAPVERRDDLCALYAFDIETAGIRACISEPMPGEIRLQWWRDAIASGGSASGHPVADALCETIARRDLPVEAFDRLLEARIFDLYDDRMPSQTAFEAYAGETASTLIMLAARILSPASANLVADAAGHAGVARLVADVLRPLPHFAATWPNWIPDDLLAAVGATAADLQDLQGAAASRSLDAMAALGLDHAGRMERLLPTVPKDVRAAFLPASLSQAILRREKRRGPPKAGESVDLSALRISYSYWRRMRG